MRFMNRKRAGTLLAECLQRFRGGDAIVWTLPRGGVVVMYHRNSPQVAEEERCAALAEVAYGAH
jgi:predicted phosphoribosyltransferase